MAACHVSENALYSFNYLIQAYVREKMEQQYVE